MPSSGSDRKSTRLNSSHTIISYAVFCLKKKKLKSDDKLGGRPLREKRQARDRPACDTMATRPLFFLLSRRFIMFGLVFYFFFFNYAGTTEIFTFSLPAALPI